MIDSDFIDQWIAHHESTKHSKKTDVHWTDEYLINLSLTDGGDAELWKFVLNTYKKSLPDHVLALLAAGPLEDVLANNGQEYIEQTEVLARKDPQFKKLLRGVWKNSMSDELWARVCDARGTAW